ncbi:hypothetical protein [Kribbella sp. CA-293567]|uniref:hypothetical protein n=1 Tax=Kribbella sp. CA-293567 TaxID=3002436 RepID=UPI0022DE10A5|nr:hypothetical protein [Kribbella sp. CA-293567]WBQ03473.1 hypothetical protein OX958_26300 [Kribbella sp. CA-293567]
MTEAEGFRWVGEEQERYLADSSSSAWQGNWPEHLGRYLDHSWPNWQQEDDERRRDWLDERVRSIALGWIDSEQRGRLDTLAATHGDWRDWLPIQLDQWWPDWSRSTPGELAAWFAGAMDGLVPRQVAAPPATATAANPLDLGWLTAEQRTQLDTLTPVRGDWGNWLPAQMDEWWPDWTHSDHGQLTTWFDSALPSLLTPHPADPRDLSWLTPEQQHHLDTLTSTRGNWQAWLPAQMDEWWPGWAHSGHGQLITWFDSALPSLLSPTAPRDVSWLSPEQRSQLDELTELRGDWHHWLTEDLDRRRPDWSELPPSELAGWFDGVLPLLLLPDAEQGLTEAMTTLTADLEADEVLQELIADFTDDDLAEIVEAALSSSQPA